MVQDFDALSLSLDFGGTGLGFCDIDGFHIDDDGFLYIVEAKNYQFRKSPRTNKQRKLLQTIADNYAGGGAILFVLHDRAYQNGDRKVDMSLYPVARVYVKGEWFTPKQSWTLKEAMEKVKNYEHNTV